MTRIVERDRCPGLLRPYRTVDGNMIRLRLPGGLVSSEQLLRVAELACRFANSEVQVTSRNNLQIRALPDPIPCEFTEAAFATGLMPSTAHERIRTVVCSPLTSIAPVHADLSRLVRELDAAIIADAQLPRLPGRFLFALDDGSDDVLGEDFDLGYRALPGGKALVFVGGSEQAQLIDADDAVPTLLELAHRFLAVAEAGERPAWHIRELPDPAELCAGIGQEHQFTRPATEQPLGFGAVAGAAHVGIPLGLLTLAQAEVVHAVATACGDGGIVVTPWRSLLIPGAADRLAELAGAGLVTSTGSVWQTLTACYGKPCSNALVDTRRIAEEVAREHPGEFPELVHLAGCDRVCGEPGGEHLGLVAPRDAAAVLEAVVR
ncbi:MAG: nitrite reductase [Propionibacteriaceae bacterium]|nr:nitrite reductase [Propionibacteriaceae bacterium]